MGPLKAININDDANRLKYVGMEKELQKLHTMVDDIPAEIMEAFRQRGEKQMKFLSNEPECAIYLPFFAPKQGKLLHLL